MSEVQTRRRGRVKGQKVEPVVISEGLVFAVEEALPKTLKTTFDETILTALRASVETPLSGPVSGLGGTLQRATNVLRRHAAHLGQGVAIREGDNGRVVFQMRPRRVRKTKEEGAT